MIELDGATFLVQWAAGGWVFLWVTTRRREVGLGYGWLQRGLFLALGAGSLLAAFLTSPTWPREIATMVFMTAGMVALGVSVARKSAGVAGQRQVAERRSARVAEMTGIDREEQRFDPAAPEFPPALDLVAASLGMVAVVIASVEAGGPVALSVAPGHRERALPGLGHRRHAARHWYLVQPGLARGPLLELVKWTGILWLPHVIVFLWPTGMVSVLNGDIDDAYNGLLGCSGWPAPSPRSCWWGSPGPALREREYSAVMAATGLLYLAILTAFGQDLVAGYCWRRSAHDMVPGVGILAPRAARPHTGSHAESHLERVDQLRAGEHPGEALQRGEPQERAVQTRSTRPPAPACARSGCRPPTVRRCPTSAS